MEYNIQHRHSNNEDTRLNRPDRLVSLLVCGKSWLDWNASTYALDLFICIYTKIRVLMMVWYEKPPSIQPHAAHSSNIHSFSADRENKRTKGNENKWLWCVISLRHYDYDICFFLAAFCEFWRENENKGDVSRYRSIRVVAFRWGMHSVAKWLKLHGMRMRTVNLWSLRASGLAAPICFRSFIRHIGIRFLSQFYCNWTLLPFWLWLSFSFRIRRWIKLNIEGWKTLLLLLSRRPSPFKIIAKRNHKISNENASDRIWNCQSSTTHAFKWTDGMN